MSKNKMIACALLVAVAASFAGAAFAAGSEPPQIPGYDRSGNSVPLPNPDRS